MRLHALSTRPRRPAPWFNEHQPHVVDYLREENRLLKQQLRGQRLRLTDDDRRRLAAKGVLLGRKLLTQVATMVTPETILAWHRKLVGKAMTCGRRSPGRPQKSRDLAALVVKMAKDNPSWGYDRLEGAFKNLGHYYHRRAAKSTRQSTDLFCSLRPFHARGCREGTLRAVSTPEFMQQRIR